MVPSHPGWTNSLRIGAPTPARRDSVVRPSSVFNPCFIRGSTTFIFPQIFQSCARPHSCALLVPFARLEISRESSSCVRSFAVVCAFSWTAVFSKDPGRCQRSGSSWQPGGLEISAESTKHRGRISKIGVVSRDATCSAAPPLSRSAIDDIDCVDFNDGWTTGTAEERGDPSPAQCRNLRQ